MLDNLLNSKLKTKLLGILFCNPERGFSPNELKEMARASLAQVNNCLHEFARADVVRSVFRKQKRCYKVNSHFHLYQELRDLLKETRPHFEDLISKKLKKFPGLELAVLSGIFVLYPKLPVDILLVGTRISRKRLDKFLGEIEKLTGFDINFAVLSVKEYKYRKIMNDRFVRDILDYPHLVAVNKIKH